jgi:hypothetical protein
MSKVSGETLSALNESIKGSLNLNIFGKDQETLTSVEIGKIKNEIGQIKYIREDYDAILKELFRAREIVPQIPNPPIKNIGYQEHSNVIRDRPIHPGRESNAANEFLAGTACKGRGPHLLQGPKHPARARTIQAHPIQRERVLGLHEGADYQHRKRVPAQLPLAAGRHDPLTKKVQGDLRPNAKQAAGAFTKMRVLPNPGRILKKRKRENPKRLRQTHFQHQIGLERAFSPNDKSFQNCFK